MVNRRIINKKDYGRGKKVLYSLSEIARKKAEINLLNSDATKTVAFKRIFEKIFFYEIYHRPFHLLKSVDDFKKFLQDNNISEKDLTELSHNIRFDKSVDEKTGKWDFVNRFKYTTYVVKTIYGLQIKKTEAWTWVLENNYRSYDVYYEYSLPGISINEFMLYDYWGLQPKLQDVKESFSLLEKYGLIKKALLHANEVRFMLTNSNLNRLAHDLASTSSLEADYLNHKWHYSKLPNKTEFERLNWILGKELAYGSFEDIKKFRKSHGIRWKLMDRKTRQQYKKHLEQQFRAKAIKLKKNIDWIKKKYSTVLKDYEFMHDVLGIISPMVVNAWTYSDKLSVKPDEPRNQEYDIDDSDLEPISQLTSILWIDKLEFLITKKKSSRLYILYQQYLDIFRLLESLWYVLIDDYYAFIHLLWSQKILINKIIKIGTQNKRVDTKHYLTQEEYTQRVQYAQNIRNIQRDYDDIITCIQELMPRVGRIANTLIASNNRITMTSFTLYRQSFIEGKYKISKSDEDYAQLIKNETDWYKTAINPQRDTNYRVDIQVRDDNAIIYPHPALDDRFIVGQSKMYELKKDLEESYPELLTIDDELWSIIEYIKHNPRIKMNDMQESKFHDIISGIGIQLPDFVYLANGIQKFLQRFHEIFNEEGIGQPIIASSRDVR
jgi:hypothetical protein